jgi:hypothetical protein
MTEQPNAALFKAWLLRSASGSWLAISAELVGCYALGTNEREALSGLTAAIFEFYHWLSQHDDYTPRLSGPIRIEKLGTFDLTPGVETVFLADDNEPINDEDLDWLLTVLSWAYDDLVRDARQRADAPACEALLNHTAARQAQFISLALNVPPPSFAGSGLERVIEARATALHLFRVSTPEQRKRIRDVEGQRWSLRSGLRASVLLARRVNETIVSL